MSDVTGIIGVLYLGHRGGGAGITEALCKEINKAEFKQKIFLNSKNEILSNYSKICPNDVIEINAPYSSLQLLNPISFIKCFKDIIKALNRNSIKTVLVTMHHPYSVLMVPLLKIIGVNVISAIHDFIPHEGDKKILLHTANFIIILFSSSVIFFSKNQFAAASERFSSYKSKFTLLWLANDFRRSNEFSKPKIPSYDYIFFGRLEPYKGIARLKEAWKFVIEEDPDATLLVRGKGPSSKELLELGKMHGVDCRIGYVKNSEIENLMSQVKIILASHDTATQSGITGIAATYGMLAVATPCNGFLEQAEYNCRIILAEDFQPSSFALTMLDAKRRWNWDLVHEDLIINSGFVDKYLLD